MNPFTPTPLARTASHHAAHRRTPQRFARRPIGQRHRSHRRFLSTATRRFIAPNNTAGLIQQAGVITRRMNETLSDLNVVEGNIRLGEAVSTTHMVLSEGIQLGAVATKGLGVVKNVATLGGHLVRGSGTLGVGGRVVTGMPGTAAGDIINASIRDQQLRILGGGVGSEAASTVVGGIFVNEVGRLSNEVQDAFGSGRGALDAAYGAGAALQRSYYEDAARLQTIRRQIEQARSSSPQGTGTGGGGG